MHRTRRDGRTYLPHQPTHQTNNPHPYPPFIPMSAMKNKRILDEVFVLLVKHAAESGKFDLGNIKSEEELRLLARHLRGVARILIQEYNDGGDE